MATPAAPVTLPPGVALTALDETPSTNGHARALADAGEHGPMWIWAKSQSAGRGRRGRGWSSPPGNLYATLLLTTPAPARLVAQLGFVAALAIADMIEQVGGGRASARLKWPNDVLVEGAKVAGILLETLRADDRRTVVAIGCGVNLKSAPADARWPATSLSDLAIDIDPAAGLEALAAAFAARLSQWRDGAGAEAIRDAWRKLSVHGPGQPIAVACGDGEVIRGRFARLADDGGLVVNVDGGGERTVHAGDVSIAVPAGYKG